MLHLGSEYMFFLELPIGLLGWKPVHFTRIMIIHTFISGHTQFYSTVQSIFGFILTRQHSTSVLFCYFLIFYCYMLEPKDKYYLVYEY